METDELFAQYTDRADASDRTQLSAMEALLAHHTKEAVRWAQIAKDEGDDIALSLADTHAWLVDLYIGQCNYYRQRIAKRHDFKLIPTSFH